MNARKSEEDVCQMQVEKAICLKIEFNCIFRHYFLRDECTCSNISPAFMCFLGGESAARVIVFVACDLWVTPCGN